MFLRETWGRPRVVHPERPVVWIVCIKGRVINTPTRCRLPCADKGPTGSAEGNLKLERSRFEEPAAYVRDVEGRRAVLDRRQPAQFVHVEVRVGLLAERKAD